MKLTFSESAFYGEIQREVHAICGHWLKLNNQSFINFGRMFDDGSCILLSSNNHINEYLFSSRNPIFTPIPKDLIKKNFFYLIPETGPYQKAMHGAAIYFKVRHAFDYFEIHQGHIDVWSIGSPKSNGEVYNYYFNNLDVYKNFFISFKEKAGALLKANSKNKLILPDYMRLNFNSTAYFKSSSTSKFKNKYFYLTGPYENIYFTRREAECLAQLTLGFSLKKTSDLLNLSPRTIETYLNNVKNKLGCNKKSEVISILLQNGFKDYV